MPRGAPALPLWFGTGIHEALAQWYGEGTKRGIHPADAWLDWIGEEEKYIRVNNMGNEIPEDNEFVGAKELGETMLEGYVEHYGQDENWDVIAIESPFQIDIPHPSAFVKEAEKELKDMPGVKSLLAIYAGTFDGVYRDLNDDEIWLMEHKTAKNISISHLPLDDQAGSYWAIASKILQHKGVLRRGDKIKGIMYNFLRKAMPDSRPENEEGQKLNKDGSVSKQQPKPLFEREPVYRDRRERATQLRRIQNEALVMEAARLRPDRITKNPTDRCSWDCAFYEMCLLHEKGGNDWKDYRDAMFARRDPYADHRKSAEE